MTWVKLDDSFAGHAKIRALSHPAFRLHVAALCHCAQHLTDGLVSRLALTSVGANANLSRPGAIAKTLVREGLWEEATEGFMIHDYLDYNPGKAEIREKRAATAERNRRWRTKNDPQSDASPNGVTNASANAGPVPTRTTKGSEGRGGTITTPRQAPSSQPGKQPRTPPANGTPGLNPCGCTHGKCRDLDRCYYA